MTVFVAYKRPPKETSLTVKMRLAEISPVAEIDPVETEVNPAMEAIVEPNETEEEPNVTELFVNAAFDMFVNVLEEPLIDLPVSVCVAFNKTTLADNAVSVID